MLQKLVAQLPTLESLLDVLLSNCRMEKVFLVDVLSKLYLATDSSPVDMATYELCSDMIDVILDVAAIYGTAAPSTARAASPGASPGSHGSAAIIKLSSGMVLYLREVNKFLALVALIRGDKFEKQGLIDYNFDILKRALTQLFDVARVHNLQQAQKDGPGQGQGQVKQGQSVGSRR